MIEFTTKERDLSLNIAFEGVTPESGISLKMVSASLAKLQSAFEMLVRDCCKDNWVGVGGTHFEEASALAWRGARAGSLTHTFEVSQGWGEKARERLLNWSGDPDDDSLPEQVRQTLLSLADDWPDDLTAITLSDQFGERTVTVFPPTVKDAYATGTLKEVNWHDRTARLRYAGDEWVNLRFTQAQDIMMKQHANTFIKVRGKGKVDANGDYMYIEVGEIDGEDYSDPEDYMTALQKRIAKAKPYDPERRPRAPEDFDVEEFIRIAENRG